MRKKGVLLVVALAAILGVCACGTKQKKEAVFPELIIGGTSYTPYFYQDINGNYSGIDVDVAKEACKRAGYTPVFQMITIEDRFVELENKKVSDNRGKRRPIFMDKSLPLYTACGCSSFG